MTRRWSAGISRRVTIRRPGMITQPGGRMGNQQMETSLFGRFEQTARFRLAGRAGTHLGRMP